MIQDVLKNGLNSEYIKDLPEEVKKEFFDLIKGTYDMFSLVGKNADVILKSYDEIAGIAYNYIAKKYDHLVEFEIHSPTFAKRADNLGNMASKLWANKSEAIRLGKKIKGLGTAISAFEFGAALGGSARDFIDGNFNEDSIDRVVLATIDFGASFIPNKNLEMAVSETAKLGYESYAKNRDQRANLEQFSKSNSSSSDLLALYSNSYDETVSFEMLEEYYIENEQAAELDPDTVIMNGGADNDAMLNNMFDLVWMDGDDGDDNIQNYNSKNVTMYGNTGRDLLTNLNSSEVQIYGGAGADTIISNYSSNVTIDSGDGDDYITLYDNSKVKLSTGTGKDSVTNIGKYASIQTGDGADSIFNIGANVSINSGGGDDEIESCGDEVTIRAGAGNNSICLEGEIILLTTGDGNNSINTEEFYHSFIQTGSGEDEIFNLGNNNTINAGSGDNVISNIGDHNSILTGTGDDCVENVGNSNIFNVGEGNDLILLIDSSSNTVTGGKGNDLIYLEGGSKNKIRYASGDGNDTIIGMTASDTLIISGTTYSTTKSGKNIVVTAGSGKITLEDTASLSSVKINGTIGGGKDTTPSGDDTIPSSKNISNSKAGTLVTGTAYNDTIKNSASKVTIQGGDGKDRISLSSAAKNNIIVGGAGNDSIYSSVTSGVLFNYAKGDGNDYIKGWTAKDTLTITGGAYKTSTTGNDVIVSIAGGEKITLVGAKSKTINVKGTSSGSTVSSSGKNLNNTKASTLVSGTSYADTIKNSASKVTINGGSGADKISLTSAAKNNVIIGGAGNDSIFSSVTSGVLFNYAKGDGNDYIKGWTAKDTLSITGGAYKLSTVGNDVKVSIAGGSFITLVGAKGKTSNIKGTSSSSTVSSNGKNITNSKSSTVITGTAYADTINNSGASVKAYGSNGNDSIRNSGRNAYIDGGSGADKISLVNTAMKNTIVGGKGNDSIYSSVTNGVLYKYTKGDGNDYIKGWTAKDTLSISGGAYKLSTVGNDVKVSIAGGSFITLAGAKGKVSNIKPSSSSTSKLIKSDISSLILFDDDNFVTDSAQIDSVTEISEANYSVGKVTSLQAYDIFAQDSLPIATSYDNK